MSQAIAQEIEFSAPVHQVFQALTDAKRFSKFSGAPATIAPTTGGAFSCFAGMITGLTIEIHENHRLVQAWRVSNWESGIYSIVRMEMVATSQTETRLTLFQDGFPDEHRSHLDKGWHGKYWIPLQKYLQTPAASK